MNERSKELYLSLRRDTLYIVLVLANRWVGSNEIIDSVNGTLSGLENGTEVMYEDVVTIQSDVDELNKDKKLSKIIYEDGRFKLCHH